MNKTKQRLCTQLAAYKVHQSIFRGNSSWVTYTTIILREQRKKWKKKHDEKIQKLRYFDAKSKTDPSCSLTADRNQEQKTWHVTSPFDASYNVKPFAYFSLVFYSILNVFTEYFYHFNGLFWDAILLLIARVRLSTPQGWSRTEKQLIKYISIKWVGEWMSESKLSSTRKT